LKHIDCAKYLREHIAPMLFDIGPLRHIVAQSAGGVIYFWAPRTRGLAANAAGNLGGNMPELTINGRRVTVDMPDDTPLLWVIREHLQMTGTKFGCGGGFCGACTVHLDGTAVKSCQTTLATAADGDVTTIEGLSANGDHPLQRAWIVEQVPQCGYCQSGQIMAAAALLAKNPHPTHAEIGVAMNGNLCRCMTYSRIEKAIVRASEDLRATNDATKPAGSRT
jgi:isoquinoline 1-oxidoreductase subunit alpha